MPLTSMKPLLAWAEKNNCAVGAFSITNMETMMGVIEAAEEYGLPVILQIAEKRLSHSPLALIAPMMLAAARTATVDVAVHFDHGVTVDGVTRALQAGFTSVMFDGSRLPLEENVDTTAVLRRLATSFGASLEAELGIVGGSETGEAALGIRCTSPDDAEQFCRETGVDALAVAIGNAHGHYKAAPKLRFDVLEQISHQVPVPLVLHGGTGMSPDDYRTAIRLGIRKINIATSTFETFVQAGRSYCDHTDQNDYFVWNREVVRAVRDNAARHLKLFTEI